MFNPQRIKDIADVAGISQKELFTRAGIKEGTYYALFRSNSNPTSNILESIADALKCSINDFFDRTSNEVSVNIGHHVIGKGNKVSGNISLSECQKEVEHLTQLLHEKQIIIEEKERTIQILMKQQA